jgi:uncharacterized protein
VDLTAPEIRVLGCLIEKQRTTPDAYPLSLNSLRLACNQATNRDPVVDYDEATIRDALQRLGRRRWTRLASGHSSRASKYRHLLGDALGLAGDELAVLAVLMLRGPQTPGELKGRTERLHAFPDLGAVQAALERLVERGLVARRDRRPGQKEERYEQLLGAEAEAGDGPAPSPTRAGAVAAGAATAVPVPAAAPPGTAPGATATTPERATGAAAAAAEPPDEGRLDRLEEELAALRDELASLRERLDAVGA